MFGGYEGGWAPQTYITDDIPLQTYHNKNGKPYMDIRGWAAKERKILKQEMSCWRTFTSQ